MGVTIRTVCQDTSGYISGYQILAVSLKKKTFKVGGGKFTAKGRVKDGPDYDIKGKITSSGKASGTVYMSLFRYLPAFGTSELCSSKQKFKAKIKR